MIPEIGHFALMLAVMVALAQAVLLPTVPALKRVTPLLQCICVTLAFGCLIHAFVTSDFSVTTVANHSHTLKPLIYKITGSWGNHEGSMLLWIWVMGVYGAVLGFQRNAETLTTTALVLHGILQTGLLLFLLLTSNPFERVLPVPYEGNGLNPLLQDIGLAIHPPILYLGYVGLGIAFVLAVAACWHRQTDADFARMLRPWVLVPWAFLTFGIGLGSWWAYRELGWGGFWFWDPVENASLLPWLSATALLHCVLVLQKRQQLAMWVVLLAILSFSLSLIGTFLVRSGLITSVHSFANDPERGLYILTYLGLVTGGALLVFALRPPRSVRHDSFLPLSREGGIVINNLFLVVACGSILIATIYPMIQELMGGRSLTIGAPYYNKTFFPLMAPMMLLAGVAPFLAWGAFALKRKQVIPMLLAATILALLAGALFGMGHVWLLVSVWIGVWVISGHVKGWRKLIHGNQIGMLTAHLGLGLLILSLGISGSLKTQYEIPIRTGETVEAGDYSVSLRSITQDVQENYLRYTAVVDVQHASRIYALFPEIRHFPAHGSQTVEAAIDSGLWQDVYMVLRQTGKMQGNQSRLLANEAILTLYINPAMMWLWLAVLMIGTGGLIACLPKAKAYG